MRTTRDVTLFELLFWPLFLPVRVANSLVAGGAIPRIITEPGQRGPVQGW